jgi:DNA-binding NarL/FixJ family response regulator
MTTKLNITAKDISKYKKYLTRREISVLSLRIDGYTLAEIGEMSNVTRQTVRNWILQAMKKLNHINNSL